MKTSLRYKAYEEIKARIIHFEFKPGEKLVEADLVEKLSMGRTPVREAMLMLVQEKLVESRGKAGYFVRKFNKKEVEEYFALRAALEDFAAPLVIERITPSAIEALHENIRNSERYQKKGDIKSVIICHTEFDKILYAATDSEAFIETISRLLDRLHWLRAIALSVPGGPRQSVDDHKKIVKAIEEKNVQALRKAISEHLGNARGNYGNMETLFF